MNDLGKAFSFPFQDQEWPLKFLFGALFIVLCLTGLGVFVVAGYLVHVTKRVIKNDPQPMPPWSDIGVMFVSGFKYIVVYILYLLPVILLTLPAMVLGILSEGADMPEAFAPVLAVYIFGLLLVIIPYSLAFTLLLPVITYRFAVNEKISEALDIGGVIRDFKANWQTTTVIALLIVGVQSLAAIGIVAFIIGILFTIFYAYLVSAYLCGALYRLPRGGESPA